MVFRNVLCQQVAQLQHNLRVAMAMLCLQCEFLCLFSYNRYKSFCHALGANANRHPLVAVEAMSKNGSKTAQVISLGIFYFEC